MHPLITFTVLFLAYVAGYVVCLFRWTRGAAAEKPDPAVVRFTRVTVSDDGGGIGDAGVTVAEGIALTAGGTGR